MPLHKLRENSQLIGIIFAICLALTAQYLFTGEIFTHQKDSNSWVWIPRFSAALVMLILAIGFTVWAAFPQDTPETQTMSSSHSQAEAEPKVWRIWFVGSGMCYVFYILVYFLVGENRVVHWLWIAGIGLLVIPLWLQSRGKVADEKIPSWEWMVVGIISLIGFGLRYWKLTEIPSHVDNDVALMGTYGLELIKSGNYDWIGYSTSEHLLSYDQFLAWSMRLFGQNQYGIVMVSVILGTLSLIFIFLLGREVGGRFVGLTAIGLLTISYTHIQFSRILFGNTASFAAILVFYAILKGLRTQQTLWYAVAGVFVGWGLLLYDSGRVIPLIVLSMVIWQWLWQRQLFKSIYKNWVFLLAGALLAFGPMLALAVGDFFIFSGRANVVSLWAPDVWQHELESYNTNSPIQVLWQQTWRTFLTLHLTGDSSPHFAIQRPMVSPLTALLFILGLGYGLSRIRDVKYFFILSWIFLTFIFGGILTSDPPYWPHLNIALPSIILAAAVGAKVLANKLVTLFGQVGYKVYAWVLVGVVIITGISNWQIYYDYVKNNAGNRIRISRYLGSLPPGYTVYLASSDWNWGEEAFRFYNREMTGQDLIPESLTTDPPIVQQPTVFILFRHPDLISTLQEHYPNGILENHYDANNLVSFVSYRVVPPEYELKPAAPPVNPLSSPGWLWLFGFILYYVGYVAYSHYSSVDHAATEQHQTTM